MATKRPGEANTGTLVPVSKRAKNEIIQYAAQHNKPNARTSSLLAPIMLLTGHEGEIFTCKFSPQGDIIASAGFDRKVFLWNVYGECENWAALSGHGGAIMDLQFSNDGMEIYTCATDKSIFIWDLNTCERIKKIKGHKSFVNSISPSRFNSSILCSGSDDATVKLWDRRQKNCANEFDNKYPVLCTAIGGQIGEQVFFAGIDNDIKVWDTRMAGLLYKMNGHTDCPTGLSLSPDGHYLASNSMDSTVRVWDVRPFAPQERCIKLFVGHTHNFERNLLRVSWSPLGDKIAAGSADKYVYVWETSSKRILYKLPGHVASVNEVDFHPVESIIASCSSDKRIYLGEIQ